MPSPSPSPSARDTLQRAEGRVLDIVSDGSFNVTPEALAALLGSGIPTAMTVNGGCTDSALEAGTDAVSATCEQGAEEHELHAPVNSMHRTELGGTVTTLKGVTAPPAVSDAVIDPALRTQDAALVNTASLRSGPSGQGRRRRRATFQEEDSSDMSGYGFDDDDDDGLAGEDEDEDEDGEDEGNQLGVCSAVHDALTVLPPNVRAQVKRLARAEADRRVKKMLAKLEQKYAGTQTAPRVPLALAVSIDPLQRLSVYSPLIEQRAVREEMKALMGIRPTWSGRRKKQRISLPKPLAAGAPVRYAPDNTRLFNPDWSVPVDEGVNLQFVTTVRDLIRDKGVEKHGLSAEVVENDNLIIKAAHTYFRTLRRQYEVDHNNEAREKHEQKLENDKHYARRKRSSEDSGSEHDAHYAERETMRKEFGAGSNALEVRALRWRGRQLISVYLALMVFARFSAEEAGRLDGLSEELSAEEREAYLDKLCEAVATWDSVYLSEDQVYDRFRGPAANHIDLPRKDKKRRPIYKECFSRKWVEETEEHLQIYNSARNCPPSFTILNLELPMELFPKRDREWLMGWESEEESVDA
ncbi:hypothetical protein BN946_scf184943.g30 [Trametes cinnabarina]|uniref:Uncharacterized protein n=1 Tax=Pycnoporus cinnabarinus TaxID=5643 RepID=A0A060SCA2_PYCCI|nr:hypothetical protein BN946_scf184943.g30 [Trametes cinnabarina]